MGYLNNRYGPLALRIKADFMEIGEIRGKNEGDSVAECRQTDGNCGVRYMAVFRSNWRIEQSFSLNFM